jgi:nucleotide-binding universal stress UspA family protein
MEERIKEGGMEKVLLAVDGSKNSKYALSVFKNLVSPPEEVILLYVERLEGGSLMTDMLGEAEMKTLKESLAGTEHKQKLDARAERVLEFCKRKIEENALTSVKTVIREGAPAEEILKMAREEKVELIVLGYVAGEGVNRFITGNIAREVERKAPVPVLAAKKPGVQESSLWRQAYYAVSITIMVFIFAFALEFVLEKMFLPF